MLYRCILGTGLMLLIAGCSQPVAYKPDNSTPVTKSVQPVPANSSSTIYKYHTQAISSSDIKVTSTDVELEIRNTLRKSNVRTSAISIKSMKWVNDNFKHYYPPFSSDSQVYTAEIEGDIVWPFPGGEHDENGVPVKDRGDKLTLTLSPIDGHVIGATMHRTSD